MSVTIVAGTVINDCKGVIKGQGKVLYVIHTFIYMFLWLIHVDYVDFGL